MLRITIHEDDRKWLIELAGKIAGPWVAELENAWRSSASSGREIEIDLRDVTGVDAAGRELLREFCAAGVRLIACGVAMTALVEEVHTEAASAKKRRGRGTGLGRIASMLGILVALGSSLHAQPSAPPAAIRLTLQDAVSAAPRANPQVAIANLDLAESQESRKIARASLLPSASLRASEDVARGNLATLAGQPIPTFPRRYGPFWSTEAGPAFSAPVFDLTLWEKWRASKENVSASAAQQTAAREQNAQLVVSQYLSGLRAAADVSAAGSRVELAKALLDLAGDQQKNGVGTSIDALRANVQYQNELQRYSEAQMRLAVSL